MGLAAQIPCEYCSYFHTKAAQANGATQREIKDAVALSSIVRHWSTFLNGMQTDKATFRREVDRVLAGGKKSDGRRAQR